MPSFKSKLSNKNTNSILTEGTIRFTINGLVHIIGPEIPSGTRLIDFIRDYAGLKGTKYMCREGGCGVCTVSVTSLHPKTNHEHTYSVNACLIMVHMCNGWAITTIEGLGSKKVGYHTIQNRLASMNGSQCGYCSPGMVMAMHSFLERKKNTATKNDIEAALGGNICRCTGYRPILDTFQSFSCDVTDNIRQKCTDIEDLMKTKCILKEKNGNTLTTEENIINYETTNEKKISSDTREENDETNYDSCFIELALSPENVQIGGNWFVVSAVREVFQIFDGLAYNQTYMLVGGNTAYGVYRPRYHVDVYIQISNIRELRTIYFYDNCVYMGSITTLTEAIDFFDETSKTNESFVYMKVLKDHLDKVAHEAVRNVGTIGGNLSIKHQFKEFPSDVFLLLETIGASIIIRDTYGLEETISPQEYLYTDMTRKMITFIVFPPMAPNTYYFRTFKIMPRAQNAHAIVNAGFLFHFDPTNPLMRVLHIPRVIFGGINPDFIHATKFEFSLPGKQLMNLKDLQSVIAVLCDEIVPSATPPADNGNFLPEPLYDPTYRKNLAISLFYKFILGLSKSEINPKFISGTGTIQDERQLSAGKEDYETKEKLWPLTKPIPKIDGLNQCAGEAEYVNDLPNLQEEYFAAVLLADRGPATIIHIDATEALRQPGVHAFLTAKDIPGRNIAIPAPWPEQIFEEEKLFADKEVEFAGQIIGAIIANDFQVAYEAVRMIHVQYSNMKTPQLDMKDIIKNRDTTRIKKQLEIMPLATKNDVQHTIKGTMEFGPQFHFAMEPQTTLCVPSEDGIDVFAASQFISLVQESVAGVLNIPNNRVNVKTRRVGGAFGSKLSRSCYPAVVAALCANHINKPVKIVMSIESMMGALGSRYPIYASYQCDVNKQGVIQKLEATFNVDKGMTLNENGFVFVQFGLREANIYDSSTFHVTVNSVKTDVPTHVFTRSPGACETTAFLEHIMDHIATEIKKDSTEVRLANLKNESAITIYKQLRDSANYAERKTMIEQFNNENRWRKKGIDHVVTIFPLGFYDVSYAILSIYRKDGTVAITTSGIEVGQGLHTKVAQACAYELGIAVEKIVLKPAQNNVFPNCANTGGSTGSDNAARCILQCCTELKSRLKPLLDKKDSWENTIETAFQMGYDLQVTKSVSALQTPDLLPPYVILTAATLEVEVDILTGQHQVTRVDILQDAGQSINPAIDIGQIHGAFIMGLGLWTFEHMQRDKTTGVLLTNRTWHYKPPGAKDIPVDFRVSLLKGEHTGPSGAFGGKAIGEPPLLASCSVMFAIKQALRSARLDAGLGEEYFDMAAPFTVESIFNHSGVKPKEFTLK